MVTSSTKLSQPRFSIGLLYLQNCGEYITFNNNFLKKAPLYELLNVSIWNYLLTHLTQIALYLICSSLQIIWMTAKLLNNWSFPNKICTCLQIFTVFLFTNHLLPHERNECNRTQKTHKHLNESKHLNLWSPKWVLPIGIAWWHPAQWESASI